MFLEIGTETGNFLIILVVAVIIIIIALLIYFFTNKRKNHEIVEEKVNQANEITNNQELQPVQENPVIQDNIVEPLPEEFVVATSEETNKNVEDIESMLKEMQQDLDASKEETFMEGIDRYEVEEEENAIISYKELMKYKENRQKEIILENKTPNEIKEVIVEKEENPKEEVKKFKRSEFISPIFGLNEETNVTYKEIKRPPKKENINREETKDKNDTFYDALVDFRNKLN